MRLRGLFSLFAALILRGAGAVLVSGCAGGTTSRALSPPAKYTEESVPAPSLGATSTELIPAAQYTPQSDGQRPPAPHAGPITLAEVLAHADRHAPAVRTARARMRRGDAAVSGARPLLQDNPEVGVGVGPRFRENGSGIDLEGSIEQRFEIAGERGLRITAAERLKQRLEAEFAQVRWQTHWEVHGAFHATVVARERVDAARRLLVFQERLLEITKQRLRAGDISPLPVRLAEGDTAQARVALMAAEQNYRASRLKLAELSGWTATDAPEPAGKLDRPRKAPPLAAVFEAAQRHQPALRAFRIATAEAQARARLADREAWPEPALGVRVQRESVEPGQTETVILGTLRMPLPLFQRNQRERALADADVQVAGAEMAVFQQQLRLQLTRSAGAVDAAAARIAAYGAEILPTLEGNLQLLQRAYELGEIDILQVAVARERFLRFQTDALDAYEDYFRAVAELEAAVGADLWPEEHDEHNREAEGGANR